MSSNNSRPWLMLTLFGLAALCLSFGVLEYRQKSKAWNEARLSHEECLRLIQQIKQLKTVPRFAVLNADSPASISARIEQTAKTSLPPGALLSIQPESARRAGNSSYVISPTLIRLQSVTLAEIASFAANLEDADQGLVISELRLNDPESGDGISPERWSSELKLTQTIYSANVRNR